MKRFFNKMNFLKVLLLVVALMFSFGANFLFNQGDTFADTTYTGISVSIKKVKRFANSSALQSGAYDYLDSTTTSPINDTEENPTADDVTNGEYIMLKNANLEINTVNDKYEVENISINIGALANYEVSWLEISAKLNDEIDLNCGQAVETESGSDDYTYTLLLDLTNLTDTDLNDIDNLEGKYTFTFEYFYRIGSDNIGPIVITKTFYLVNETSYINPNQTNDDTTPIQNLTTTPDVEVGETYNFGLKSLYSNNSTNTNSTTTEPRLINTEKIDRFSGDSSVYEKAKNLKPTIGSAFRYEDKSEYNYFNFNNLNTVNYDGVLDNNNGEITDSQKLLFPTYIYDASKYNISYTRTYNGVTYNYTTTFAKTSDTAGKLSTYLNGILQSEKTLLQEDEYVNEIVFTNVGEYVFSINYLYKTVEGNYVIVNKTANTDFNNISMVGSVKLNIFGYQLYYTDNNTTLTEYRNEDYYTDFSYYNDNSGKIVNNVFSSETLPTLSSFDIVSTKLATTNQAPVSLKYNCVLSLQTGTYTPYSFYRYYPNGVKTDNASDYTQYSYTNGTKFQQNGYYEIVLIYSYGYYQNLVSPTATPISQANRYHCQVFAFKIENLPPSVEITTGTTPNIVSLNSGDYTNKNVTVKISANESPFNVDPIIYYTAKAFSINSVWSTPSIITDEITLTQSAEYIVSVYYGPTTGTSLSSSRATARYRFYIDKTSISEPVVYEKDTTNNMDSIQINTPFDLTWATKNSGANIKIGYAFSPFEKVTNYSGTNADFFDNGYENYIKNGYQLSKVYYTPASYHTENKLTFTNEGLYIFTLTDDCGNTATKVVIFDTSSPIAIKNTVGIDPVGTFVKATYDNYIVSNTTQLIWGTHKAVSLSSNVKLILDTAYDNLQIYTALSDIDITDDITQFSSCFVNNSNIFDYYLSALKSVKVVTSNNIAIATLNSMSQIASKTEQYFYGINTGEPNRNIVGERLYYIDLSDYYSIDNLESGNNNTYSTKIHMNLDKSLVLAYTYSSDKYVALYNEATNSTKCATNRDKLYITFVDGENEYKINSLSYKYYPLALGDTTSTNYPYSQTPSEEVDLLANASMHSGTNGLSAINNMITAALSLSGTLTRQGMYVVTREYSGEVNEESTGDTTTRDYVFYVDRNPIIGLSEDYIIGELIKLSMGQDINTLQGIEFLQDYAALGNLVETNILPVSITLPIYKYFNNTVIDAIDLGNIDSSIISKYPCLNLTITINGNSHLATLADGYLTIANIIEKGNYTVTISDNTGYEEQGLGNNVNPNQKTFDFTITHKKPTGEFYKIVVVDDTTSYEQTITTTSVNADSLFFKWEDPISEYNAKIDPSKITIRQINSAGTTTTIFNGSTPNANLLINGIQTKIVTRNGKDIVTHYIDLTSYAQEEATYIVHLEYEGESSDYNVTVDGVVINYATNEYSIVVDTTPPQYNLTQLINNDEYLSNNSQANAMLQSTLNKDRTNALNFENYVFVVDNGFTLTDVSEKFETYNFYYRKYNKYEPSGTDGAYLQSIVPSDPYYSDLTYLPIAYRFSPNLTNIYSNSGYYTTQTFATVSGYYEIIETDEAGNYTIYTIFIQNNENDNAFTLSYLLDGDEVEKYVTIEDSEISPIEELDFNALTSKVKWYDITLTNNKNNATQTLKRVDKTTAELETNEYNDEADIIEQINLFTEITSDYALNGASFTIKISHPSDSTKNIEFDYNTPGKLPELTFQDYLSSFVLIIPTPTAGTYVQNIWAYEIFNGEDGIEITSVENLPNYFIRNDKNAIIGCTKDFGSTSSGSYYRFYVQDNFGRISTVEKSLNLNNIKQVDFGSAITSLVDGITYTAKTVYVTYQTNMYSVIISVWDSNTSTYRIVDLNDQSVLNDYHITYVLLTGANKGVKKICLVNETYWGVNADIQFKVEFIVPEVPIDDENLDEDLKAELEANEISQPSPIEFAYYTKLPTIKLYDGMNEIVDILNNGTTSKEVYVSFDTNTVLFPTFVNIQRRYTGTNGETLTEVFTNISDGFAITSNGRYTIIVSNSLGATKSDYIFTKKDDIAPFFSVYYSSELNARELLPSSEPYTGYTNMTLDHYFSNNQTNEVYIELNANRNLKSELVSTINVNTKIYRICTNTDNEDEIIYEKYIAISFVSLSNKILGTSFEMIEEDLSTEILTDTITTKLTGISKRIVNKEFILTWNEYFELAENKIFAKFYYNGVYVEDIKTNQVALTDTGIYTFYFYDQADNQHYFESGNLTLHYYSISLFNDLMFTINSASPIDNAVYNSSVTLQVQQINVYDHGRVTYEYYYNGVKYAIPSNTYNKTFSEIGVHSLKMEAYIDGTKITSNISFTIINPNISRQLFEYTGYKITKITNFGQDVTVALQEKMAQVIEEESMGSIDNTSYLLLNPTISGTGLYSVTILVEYEGIKPSQTFTFRVWINDDTPYLICNLADGGATTKVIRITINKYLILNQIGECELVFISSNDTEYEPVIISSATVGANEETVIELTENDTVLVQLRSNNGNTLLSFRVTKNAPLNAIAIVVIVIASVGVVLGVIFFIKYRKRLRVR